MNKSYTKENFTFPSSLDNKSIHAVIYRPTNEVKGLVQIIHGYAEHIGRYRKFMKILADQGYIVFGDDHLGHGLTAETDADLSDVGSYNVLMPMLDDEKDLNHIVRSQYYPDLPFVILGHSMGSLMLRGLLGLYPDICDKAIIMGTGDMTPALLKVFSAILSVFSTFKPGSYRSKLINKLAIGKNNSSFKSGNTGNEWLSLNKKNVKHYSKDPLCGHPGSLHTFRFLQQLMSLIRKPEHLQNMKKDLPLLFLSGEQDAFGDFGKGVNKVIHLFEDAGMNNIQSIFYPEMRHEILKEKNYRLVIKDILDFIND